MFLGFWDFSDKKKVKESKKQRDKLPIQFKPVYVVGSTKGAILHHSSLNFTNLSIFSGGKNSCKSPLICDGESEAYLFPFLPPAPAIQKNEVVNGVSETKWTEVSLPRQRSDAF